MNSNCSRTMKWRRVFIRGWIPVPDGNGRWSRLAADALIVQLGGARFPWGADLRRAGGKDNDIEKLNWPTSTKSNHSLHSALATSLSPATPAWDYKNG